MKGKIFVLALFSMLSTNCTSQKKTTEMKMPETASKEVNSTYPTQNPEKGVVRLLEKQKLFLEKHKMNITFMQVMQDNRCPMNVRCIQEGEASIEIEVMGTYTRPKKFMLSTKKNKNSFVFNGKKFTLTNIYPALSTELGKEDLEGKYVVDILVSPTN